MNNSSLSDAIKKLEEDVYNEKLDSFKTEKFQYFANVVKLLEYQDPGFFTNSAYQKGCPEALAGLAFALGALILACNPPAVGATVGIACYLAAANYIRASIAVGNAC